MHEQDALGVGGIARSGELACQHPAAGIGKRHRLPRGDHGRRGRERRPLLGVLRLPAGRHAEKLEGKPAGGLGRERCHAFQRVADDLDRKGCHSGNLLLCSMLNIIVQR
ncbi:hypothetical protein D9M70_626710 [compost metagenome]